MERRTNPLRLAFLGFLAILASASLAWGIANALYSSSDLMLRVRESKSFVAGIDPYKIPDMTYPPSASPVFAVLAYLPGDAYVRYFWCVLNLAACACLIRELLLAYGKDWSPAAKVAIALIVLAMKPVRLGLGMGQYHVIPTALVLAANRWDRAGRPWAAGSALAAALIKPTMALPFAVWFAIRGSWKSFSIAAGVQVLLFAVTCARLGAGPVQLIREWLERTAEQTAAGTIDLPTLVRALYGDLFAAGAATAIALAFGAAISYALRNKSDRGLLAFNAFVAAIFAYHRPYDLTLLAICAMYVIGAAMVSKEGLRGPVGSFGLASAAMLVIPNDPLRLVGLEWYYDVFFAAMTYCLGGTVLALVIEERSAASGISGTKKPVNTARLI